MVFYGVLDPDIGGGGSVRMALYKPLVGEMKPRVEAAAERYLVAALHTPSLTLYITKKMGKRVKTSSAIRSIISHIIRSRI